MEITIWSGRTSEPTMLDIISSQSLLDEWNTGQYVTEMGALMIRSWQVGADGFVDSQKAREIRSTRPLDNNSVELGWLSKNLEKLHGQYGNKWIAIHDEKVIGDGHTVSELMQKIEGADRPFITFIPSEPIVWTFAYGSEKL